MLEIEEADCTDISTAATLQGQWQSIGEIFVNRLVAGDAHGFNVFQFKDRSFGIGFGHPLVEPEQCSSQSVFQQDAAFAMALVCKLRTGYVGPTQAFQ